MDVLFLFLYVLFDLIWLNLNFQLFDYWSSWDIAWRCLLLWPYFPKHTFIFLGKKGLFWTPQREILFWINTLRWEFWNIKCFELSCCIGFRWTDFYLTRILLLLEHYKNTFKIFLILAAGDTVGKYPHSYLKYLYNKSNAVSTGPQMSQNWCWVPRGMGGKKSVDCRDSENVVWRVHFWNYFKHIWESQKFYLCFVF